MNQSLLSQSLSDLRNPPGQRYSGEWPRMFASDSDIKDIAEGSEVESGGPNSLLAGPQGSQESVCTLKNPSGTSTVQTTPRKQEELNLKMEGHPSSSTPSSSPPDKNDSTASTDINANPRLASHSTPHTERLKVPDLDSLSPVTSLRLDPVSDVKVGILDPGSHLKVELLDESSSLVSAREEEEVGSVSGASAMVTSSASSSQSGCPAGLSQLYQDICEQKDVIMSCLEEDNCDIDQLNAEIAKLQSMQHKYSLLEFESTKSMWINQSGEDTNFYQDKFAQLIEAEVDRRLEAESDLRIERERQERELLLLEKEQELERLRVQHEREMYLIKKKLSTATTSPPKPSTSVQPPLKISIPRYHTVGSGKSSYVEYEVAVEVGEGERWQLYRRYRQFRDLHSLMVTKYGAPVQALTFPSRKLFGSRSEAVSAERQRELQTYLNTLVTTVSKVSTCPLFVSQTREAVTNFATFFQTNNAASSETR